MQNKVEHRFYIEHSTAFTDYIAVNSGKMGRLNKSRSCLWICTEFMHDDDDDDDDDDDGTDAVTVSGVAAASSSPSSYSHVIAGAAGLPRLTSGTTVVVRRLPARTPPCLSYIHTPRPCKRDIWFCRLTLIFGAQMTQNNADTDFWTHKDIYLAHTRFEDYRWTIRIRL